MSETVREAGFAALDAVTAYRLWALRVAVFVVEQDCPYQELDGRDLEPTTRHVWVEREGAPAAYLRVLEDGPEARIGRVVVDAAHRGEGLAAHLLEHVLAGLSGRAVVLDAQAHLEGWYARAGFVRQGEDFLEDGIPHVTMRRAPD
jgi:ElaA protein